jgi:hypothetical protein
MNYDDIFTTKFVNVLELRNFMLYSHRNKMTTVWAFCTSKELHRNFLVDDIRVSSRFFFCNYFKGETSYFCTLKYVTLKHIEVH